MSLATLGYSVLAYSGYSACQVRMIIHLESQVAQNDRPLCPEVAHDQGKIAQNYGPLAFQASKDDEQRAVAVSCLESPSAARSSLPRRAQMRASCPRAWRWGLPASAPPFVNRC